MAKVKKWGVLSDTVSTRDGSKQVFFVQDWDRNYGWGCGNYVEHYSNLHYSQARAIADLLNKNADEKVSKIMNVLVNE